MKELWIKILQLVGKAFWVEIITENPKCTYYFGPFLNEAEAIAAKTGYVEDLTTEGASIFSLQINRCRQPQNLTIEEELGGGFDRGGKPNLLGQSL